MKLSSPHICGVLAALSTFAHAASTPIAPEALEFFENKIRPVLAAECYECHNAKKTKGGLRLDYRAGWQKGGDSGDAIVPGDPKKSLFIDSIKHTDPDLKMPDKAPKLDDAAIADFEKWITMGAPDPRDEPPSEQASKPTWADLLATRRTWWSLQPVKKAAIPDVKNQAWSENPVDRFLLAKMEAKQLVPAAPADPRIFIRRLTFALTGLPPKPEEVQVFVAEFTINPQSAVSNATDRLLASPRFGEHWARHWMDLMRYAETHGSEGDPEIREAWRYRDYLIRAFNSDVPVDQLIREHVAGDLLIKPRVNPDGFNESMLGTAQFRFVEHGFQPIDTLDDQVKAVDNQIDVMSKAFQGLTVSCARCHDHKFDAISQRDWTAMYGIFASTRPAQVTIDLPEVQAKNHAELEALHGKIKNALAEAWTVAADNFPARLLDSSARTAKGREVAEKIRTLEKQLANLEWAARLALKEGDGTSAATPKLPEPIAAWSFAQDASDAFGRLNSHLEGGAEVRDGRLILDGKGAYLRTDELPVDIGAKTFEAWVAPTTLDQRGGGIVSLESTDVHGFDAIVFAEKESRHWYPGSNYAQRSRSVGGTEEDAKPGELIHLAIVYRADSSIAVYRNGLPYGERYTKGELKPFKAGKSRLLLGLRHKGAGSGYFAGEIEEARLYDRALEAKEIAASFRAGPVPVITSQRLAAALSPEQREQQTALGREIEKLRTEVGALNPGAEAWEKTLADAADNPANPLHLWSKLSTTKDADFPAAWAKITDPLRTAIDVAREANGKNFRPIWNLAGADYAKWFLHGSGLPSQPLTVGEFSIEADGELILDGIYPGGVATHRLSEKHNGLLTSPRFKIETDNISVRAFGSGGAMARVIVDNYPLPSNPIYPKAILDKDEPGWERIDTAYRKGSMAYLEFGTHADLTRPLQDKKKPKRDGDTTSHYGVDQIVFHNSDVPPADENPVLAALLDGAAPKSAVKLAAKYRDAITATLGAWQNKQLTEPQRALLDALVRRGVLPVKLAELPELRPLVAEYRRVEAGVPELRHAPGVLETVAYDAPFFPRGDHLKPGELVPRGYLEVLGGQPYHTTLSGRRELADAMASSQNPLTARVAVNRIWHWLFGRGIVPTVDNFGRLGEQPTHPELLDFLAARFVERGWSIKDTIRFLVSTRAYQMSSAPAPRVSEVDPTNELLSHFRVQRLEAESIRDALLSVSGGLDLKMGGKSGIDTPRRSVYLQVKRTNLQPFLQVFDAPKPFTTLGRRDATNVPAQSLTLLNSPFVIEQANRWAKSLIKNRNDSAETRVREMFTEAFARPPIDDELVAATNYLAALTQDRGLSADPLLTSEPVWQDFAQSLFNLKEFIYLR